MFTAAATLSEQLAIEQVGPDEFISKVNPGRFGNTTPIAYGGCTAGVAIRAACATVPEGYHLYSLLGHFLGPASTETKLLITVERTRDTKTFATRRVVARQELPGGQIRSCVDILADFHVEEPALLSYSTPPRFKYSGPHESPALGELVEQAADRGLAERGVILKSAAMFAGLELFFHARTCVEGMSGQNLVGILSKQPTSQDGLPATERASGDWAKTKVPLKDAGEKAATVVFLMDGGLPFTALSHNKLWFGDAGACSTLDFAVRFFAPDVDLSNWHLRERRTIAAGYGRSYSEGNLWDEQGNLAVSMTQQCILRPRPSLKPKASL